MADGKIYDSISDAAKDTGVNRTTLSQIAKDDRLLVYKLVDKKDATTLTTSQRHCVELIALTIDVHKMTMPQIANEVRVKLTNVFSWKKDPKFIEYQNNIGKGVSN
ncbi:phBC6A51 family helix-turn-helix protein [Priestia megaterium]|uniref:phBC6A51 family helix-turn-helix protein n=1 Tax=Priestia megaterium TaxID=1404 RepID=UPI00287755DE|nr:phBC6A51 family helix-turn-helix protein [Priestia megaterium]